MKSIKLSLVLAVVIILMTATAFYFVRKDETLIPEGMVFVDTQDIKRIEITTPAESFNLIMDDGLWKVKEKSGYYANYIVMKHLFESFKEARYMQRADIDFEDSKATNIRLMKENGKLVQEISIIDEYSVKFAKKDDGVFVISGSFNLPKEVYAWLEQPLMSLNERDIQSIQVGDKVVSRNLQDQPLGGDIDWADNQRLFEILSFMVFQDVARETTFEFDAVKDIEIITFGGMKVLLRVYSQGDDYWVSKKMVPELITVKGVREYISDHSMLYDGWYFKISPYYGEQLINYGDKRQ